MTIVIVVCLVIAAIILIALFSFVALVSWLFYQLAQIQEEVRD